MAHNLPLSETDDEDGLQDVIMQDYGEDDDADSCWTADSYIPRAQEIIRIIPSRSRSSSSTSHARESTVSSTVPFTALPLPRIS